MDPKEILAAIFEHGKNGNLLRISVPAMAVCAGLILARRWAPTGGGIEAFYAAFIAWVWAIFLCSFTLAMTGITFVVDHVLKLHREASLWEKTPHGPILKTHIKRLNRLDVRERKVLQMAMAQGVRFVTLPGLETPVRALAATKVLLIFRTDNQHGFHVYEIPEAIYDYLMANPGLYALPAPKPTP